MSDPKKALIKLIQWWGTKCIEVQINVGEEGRLDFSNKDKCECINKNGEDTKLRHPFQIDSVIKILCKNILDLDQIMYDSIDVDDPNISEYEVSFNFKSNKFIVVGNYNYFYLNDSVYQTKDFSKSSDTLEIFEDYTEAGHTGKWIVTFDGWGDTGEIHDIMTQQDKSIGVSASLQDLLYGMLNNAAWGWDQNEGSTGHFSIDLDSAKITLEFRERQEIFEDEVIYETTIDELINEISVYDDGVN